jgi:hypothetical protein
MFELKFYLGYCVEHNARKKLFQQPLVKGLYPDLNLPVT